jgi:hypothetical protein
MDSPGAEWRSMVDEDRHDILLTSETSKGEYRYDDGCTYMRGMDPTDRFEGYFDFFKLGEFSVARSIIW